METELTPYSGESVVSVADGSLFSVLAQAIENPNIDPAKMRELLEMKLRIEAVDAENAFYDAMLAAQEQMGPIVKSITNPITHSKFAPVEHIQRAIRPIYREHGFGLNFTGEPAEVVGNIRLVCIVAHKVGHRAKYVLEASVDDKGPKGEANKTGVQGAMSTTSYLRRKLYELIFDLILVKDDDDGNLGKGMKPVTREQADTLYRLLDECGMTDKASRAPFYKLVGVDQCGKIPAQFYEIAETTLKSKLRAIQKAAANA